MLTYTAGTTTERWRDTKRYWWALGLIVPLLPINAIWRAHMTGQGWQYWSGPILVFLFIPLLDLMLGTDRSNAPDWATDSLASDRYYRWLTYLFIPLQYVAFFWSAYEVATQPLRWWEYLGLSLTVGTVGGIAINTAHELGHKSPKVERNLAIVALAQTGYGHFCVEHNRGHHLRVATPEDPASSRLGESFWTFLPRTIVGSARSAWDLEHTRLTAQGRRVFGFDNGVLVAWLLSVALFGGTIAVFGVKVIPFLAIQAVFGFSLLEVVNYLEHYGLMRQKTETGRYERCRPEHSWNSNHRASNVFLYHLERHSDHHAHPTRRYQVLRNFDDAPQLPNGYAGMILLAVVPPLWRRVMDPKVLAHYGGDASLANVAPRKRRRYGLEPVAN